MSELNMDDPFGFNKSLEYGELKLEGEGKLYGQDMETPIDGLECKFEATVRLKGRIKGDLHLIPLKPPSDLDHRVTQVWKLKKEGIWITLLRLESHIEGKAFSLGEVALTSVTGFGSEIRGEFHQLEWGDVNRRYESCMTWVPNFEFGGCDFTEYEKGRVGRRDTCQFSFPALGGETQIQIRQLPEHEEVLRRLKQTRDSAITSVCELSFASPQSSGEIQSIVDDFFLIIAFIVGQRILPLAYWLRGETDALIISLERAFPYGSATTWCRYDWPGVLQQAVKEFFPWYISQPNEFQDLIKWIIDIYVTMNRSVFEVRIVLLSTLYEMYVSMNKLLDQKAKNYLLSKSSRKRLGENLKKFLKAETRLAESKISEWVNSRIESFIRRPFKEQIEALFREQGISCIKEHMDDFVDARNAIVHPNLKELGTKKRFDSHDPRFHIALRYMLRQFEVITLKMMGYTGEFQDRCNDYRRIPFSQMLEELKTESQEG